LIGVLARQYQFTRVWVQGGNAVLKRKVDDFISVLL